MKQVLTREMVQKAMDDAKANGKKGTLAALHAALGHRGSMSTLVQLRAELEAAAQPAADSEEGLKAFREVWALAREEGRKQLETALADLKKDVEVLAQENERLDGTVMAAANEADEFKRAKAEMEAGLANLRELLANKQESLLQAGADTRAALERLASEQAAHQKTRLELAKAIQKAHDFELELVQCRTLVEAQAGRTTK